MRQRHAVYGQYVAHLASDRNQHFTACGEPWQGWQEPFDADLERVGPAVPPMDPPRPHVDTIRQCQACIRVTLRSSGNDA